MTASVSHPKDPTRADKASKDRSADNSRTARRAPALSTVLPKLLDDWCRLAKTARYLRPQDFRWRLTSSAKRLAHESLPTPLLCSIYRVDPRRAVSVAAIPTRIDGRHLQFDVAQLMAHRFSFLNLAHQFPSRIVWNQSGLPKLWLYNLHYFDYVLKLAHDEGLACAKAVELMRAWIEDNPIGRGNGWEPYPLALRIVNWLRFLKAAAGRVGRDDTKIIHRSLLRQASFLAANLEPSGYSNHTLKSRKALVFAYAGGGGLYCGNDGDAEKYAEGFVKELSRQVLEDGGHDERSPMYHLLALEDALDVLALLEALPTPSPELLRLTSRLGECIGRMLHFALALRHPDGTLAAFNDCSHEIAPPASSLEGYAHTLGLHADPAPSAGAFVASGYYVLTHPREASRLILDAGPLGPDHNPGHAHCDALSYELSYEGRPWVVNSGTYGYDRGAWRDYFRGTSAHNTVSVDDHEQAELWASFRAATRLKCRVDEVSPTRWVGSHDGFRRLSGDCVHTRRVAATDAGWSIHDSVTGCGEHTVRSFIHLHPDVEVCPGGTRFELRRGNERAYVEISTGVQVTIDTGSVQPIQGWHASEFGKRVPNGTLTLSKTGGCPLELTYTLSFNAGL